MPTTIPNRRERCLQTLKAKLDGLGVEYLEDYYLFGEENGVKSALQTDVVIPSLRLGVNVSNAIDVSYDTREDWPKNTAQRHALIVRSSGGSLVNILAEEFDTSHVWPYLKARIESSVQKRTVIGARTCDIVNVPARERARFLATYHAHGNVTRAKHTLGLVHDGTLVALFAIGKSRYNADGMELLRYCVRPDVAVAGGFDRLLAAARPLLKGKKLTTFVDLNWQLRTTSVYERSFRFTGLTTPDYRWVNPVTADIRSRYSCMKHRLVAEGADPALSENRIMWQRGYVRVFGAGSIRFELIQP